jgi:LysM repeat protein
MSPKRPTTIKGIAALVLALFVLVVPCYAGTFHTIRKGESLATVANAYYGDPGKAIFLMAFNNIEDPLNLKPGRKIELPEIRLHRVEAGDTLALIAKKYLNDARKHRGLAKINRIKDPKSLSPDMTIIIPVEIGYTVRRGDSLSSIARKYYGEADDFTLIAVYNDISDPANLEPGTHLTLPIFDLRITAEKKRAEAPVEPSEAPSQGKGSILLEKGVQDYFRGEYLGAVIKLENAVSLGLGEKETASKALRFLAYAYIALDERERAKESFRQALSVDPTLDLDPVYVSPKIIEIFREAKAEKGD